HADALARSLQSMGFDVFWDNEIPPGRTWADFLESKLKACKVMVVLWSARSVGSQWVREEARIGRDSGKLIPVMMDGTSPPFGFRRPADGGPQRLARPVRPSRLPEAPRRHPPFCRPAGRAAPAPAAVPAALLPAAAPGRLSGRCAAAGLLVRLGRRRAPLAR